MEWCECKLCVNERRKVDDDRLYFGKGFMLTKPDGHVEHIPLDRITFHASETE